MELYPNTLQKARREGFSDDDIKGSLAADPKFAAAFEEGFTLDDVARHFEQQIPPVKPYLPRDETEAAADAAFASLPPLTPLTETERQKEGWKSIWEDLNKTFVTDKAMEAAKVSPDTVGTLSNFDASGVSSGLKAMVGEEKFNEFAAGGINKLEEVAAGFVSPIGIGLLGLGALPKAVQKIAGLAFLTHSVQAAPEKVKALTEAKTAEEKGAATADLIATVGMGAGGYHMAAGRPGVGGKGKTPRVGNKDIEVAIDRTVEEVAKAEPPPAVPEVSGEPTATAPPAEGVVPAIRVGDKVIPGKQGETHQQIVDRYVEETGDVDALNASLDEGNRLFVKPDGTQLTREQLRQETGAAFSEDLRDIQAKAAAETTGTPPEPPKAEQPATATTVKSEGQEGVPKGNAEKLSAAQLNERIDVLISKHKAETDPAAQSKIWEELKAVDQQLRIAEGQSMGPGAASAEEFIKQRELGSKNASVDKQRAARGQEPLMSQTRGKHAELWDRAMDEIAKDEEAPSRVVDEVHSGEKQSISDVEQQMLLHEMVKLTNERDMALERAGDELSTKSEREAAAKKAEELEARLSLTEEANRKAGTLSSSALSVRRQMVRDDFTPAGVERKLRAEKQGPLTPEERQYAAEVSDKILKALDEADKSEQEFIDSQLKKNIETDLKQTVPFDRRVLDYAEKVVKRWEADAVAARKRLRSRLATTSAGIDPTILSDVVLVARALIARGLKNSAEFSSQAVREFGTAIEPYIDKAWEQANAMLDKVGAELPERRKKAVREKIKGAAGTEAERKSLIAGVESAARENPDLNGPLNKYVKLLYRNFAEGGMRGADTITAAVKNILEPLIPGITDRQVMEAYSDYGISKPPPTAPAKVHLSQIRGEIQKILQLEDIVQKQEAPKPTGQQRVPPSDYSRRLTKLINEAKKKYNIQPSDPARALRSALDSRKTYYRNRMTDMKFEIGKRERIVKEKSAGPTDPELESLKRDYEELKTQHDEIFGDKTLTDEQRLDIALKATERAEAAAKVALENARKGVFPTKRASPTSAELESAKARVSAIRAEVQELREMSDAFRQEAEAKRIAALEKQIVELDQRLKEGDISTKPRTEAVMSPEMERLVSERDAMRQQLQEMRNAAKPKRTPDEIALASYKARLAREEADLLDRNLRADAGDATAFTRPKPKPIDISKSPETMRAKAKVQQLKSELNRKANEYALKNRTFGKKIWDGIQQTRMASRNIISSFDLSAPRQASKALLGRPIMGFRNVWEMLKGFSSEAKAREIEQQIHNRPNAVNGVDKAAGVEFTPLDETSFTKAEENARSVLDDWAQLPLRTGNATKSIVTTPAKLASRGVRMSNRAFITFLNKMRADLLDAYLKENFKNRAPSQLELEVVGNLVNVLTGRGKLKPQTASVAAQFIWAPKLQASHFQFLAGQPFYRGTATTRMIVAKEYARILVGGYMLWKVSQLFSDKHETDPRSSDFGKIVRGNIRLDPWGGAQQSVVLTSRLVTGETKSAKTDKVKSIRGDVKYGDPTAVDVMSNYLRSKLAPDLGTTVDVIQGKSVTGEKVTPATVATNLGTPLGFRDIAAVMRQEGIPEAVILQILSAFGMGLAVYEEHEKVNRP